MKTRNLKSPIFFFLLFTCFSLQAQDKSKIDSLKNSLKTTSVESEKAKLYSEISWEYINNSQLNQATTYADSIRLMGEESKDNQKIAFAEFYYGVIARHKGENTDALQHLNNYTRYYTSTGDSTKVSHGLFQIGSIYARIGNYEQSLRILFRALRIHESQNNQSSINFALNSIAFVLESAKRYDEALEMYGRILATDSLNAMVLMNMGSAFLEKNELKQAETNYLKALKIDEVNNDEIGVAYDLESLGKLYNHMEKYDAALHHHSRALQIRKKFPDKISEAVSLSQVGLTHIKLKNYELARRELTSALIIAKKTKTKDLIKDIYQKLAILYSDEGDFDKAYEFLESFTLLKDSLLNEESAKQVAELQTKYETEKKNQQITLLAQEKEVQQKEAQRQATLKNAMIGGLVLIALLAGLLFYTFHQRLKNQKALASKNEEIKEVNFKRQLTELEMKALQAQINPHFIFNCMNSINQMILDGDNKNASKYLTKFGKLIRMVLENAESTEVSLKDELALLEAYIQLESLRFNGEIKYNIDIKGDIDLQNTYLPSMVLQPFVENAIWHGLLHRKDTGNGQISISIEQQGEQLVCQIEDNGVGRQKAFELQQRSVYKSKSLGLKITEERLRLISKELQMQLIHITDLKDQAGGALGTRVTVNIPIS